MTSATCARLLILHRTPPLLPLLARLPTYNPTTLRHQFRHQFQQLRHASKKASRAATKKKVIPPAPAVKATPPPPPLLSQIPKYVSLAESLGNSGGQNIILYTSNDRLFIVGCYGLATAMIAWSVYTWDTNIAKRRPGVPSWVVSATYVSITVMTLLAGVVSYYPTRIIQRIHAHAIPGTLRKPASVSITLFRRPVLPLLPMRKIHVSSPELISLGESLQPRIPTPPESGMEDRRSTVAKVRHGITGAPFRLFNFFRKALSTEGFVVLKVDDEGRFRLSKDGQVWERRGLDRLFKVQKW